MNVTIYETHPSSPPAWSVTSLQWWWMRCVVSPFVAITEIDRRRPRNTYEDASVLDLFKHSGVHFGLRKVHVSSLYLKLY